MLKLLTGSALDMSVASLVYIAEISIEESEKVSQIEIIQ